jgi:integrase
MASLRLIARSEFNLLMLTEDSDDDSLDIPYLEDHLEITKFLDTAKRWQNRHLKLPKESPYYDLYYVALHTGMRKGELKGLSEDDIDFTKGVITVRRQWITSLRKFGPTKSGLKRYIPFDPDGQMAKSLKTCIARTKKIQQHKKVLSLTDIGTVFCTTVGKRISGDCFAANHFKLILNQAGLNPAITFHGLRRTFANWYYRSMGQIQPVQEILGHANEATTRIYLNLSSKSLPPIPPTVCERR